MAKTIKVPYSRQTPGQKAATRKGLNKGNRIPVHLCANGQKKSKPKKRRKRRY
jgi:hypothetical protein